jgi:ABC-type multidrug transport system fused ATPase/permease subunit
MISDDDSKLIKRKFKSGIKGIIHNSGGLGELLWTKFNFWSGIIALLVITLYRFNIKEITDELKLIDSLNSAAISLLGGIVGLSLAGLTLIITFGNPEVIERSSKKQSEQFQKENNFNVSYFQKAIAKFTFIVFFQVCVLILFFLTSTIRSMDIKINENQAHWINTIIFCLGSYLIIFSLVLVLASIMNLFTFSQTSTHC